MNGEGSTQDSHFSRRPDLLVCLQRDCSCLVDTLELLYADKFTLTRPEVGDLYASLRYGGVSSRQVNAAISKVCSHSLESGIRRDELAVLLPELDRRYFIIQGAQWEFALLDRNWKGEITEKDALFLFKAVHGNRFNMQTWETFIRERAEQGSKVTWEEIEVPLCDIPDEDGNIFFNVEGGGGEEERGKRREREKPELSSRNELKDCSNEEVKISQSLHSNKI